LLLCDWILLKKKYEERYVGAKDQGATRPMLKRSQPEDREEPQWPLKGKVGPNGMVIRGVTFYKANTVDDGAAEELSKSIYILDRILQ
jgi:hypothetical protein